MSGGPLVRGRVFVPKTLERLTPRSMLTRGGIDFSRSADVQAALRSRSGALGIGDAGLGLQVSTIGDAAKRLAMPGNQHPLQSLLARSLEGGLLGLRGNPFLAASQESSSGEYRVGVDGSITIDEGRWTMDEGMVAAGGRGKKMSIGGLKKRLRSCLKNIEDNAQSRRSSQEDKDIYSALAYSLAQAIPMLDRFSSSRLKLEAGQDLLKIADLARTEGTNLDLIRAILGKWIERAGKLEKYNDVALTVENCLEYYQQGRDFRIALGHLEDRTGKYEWNGKPVKAMTPLEIGEIFKDLTRGSKHKPFVALAKKVLDSEVLLSSVHAERMTSSPTTAMLAASQGIPHVAQVIGGAADCTPKQLYKFFLILSLARHANIGDDNLAAVPDFMGRLRTLSGEMLHTRLAKAKAASGKPGETRAEPQDGKLDFVAQLTGQQVYDAFMAYTRGEKDRRFQTAASKVLAETVLPSFTRARQLARRSVTDEPSTDYQRIGPDCTPAQLAKFFDILERARGRRERDVSRDLQAELARLSQEIKNSPKPAARVVAVPAQPAKAPIVSELTTPTRSAVVRPQSVSVRRAQVSRLSPGNREQLLLDHVAAGGAIEELEAFARGYGMLADAARKIIQAIRDHGYQAYRLKDQFFFLQFMFDADKSMSNCLAKYLPSLAQFNSSYGPLLKRVLRLRFLGVSPTDLSNILVRLKEDDPRYVRYSLERFEALAVRTHMNPLQRDRISDDVLVKPSVSTVAHARVVSDLKDILRQGIQRTRIYKFISDNYVGGDTQYEALSWVVERGGRLAYELGLLLGRSKHRGIIERVVTACYYFHGLQRGHTQTFNTAYRALMNILISRRYGSQRRLMNKRLDGLNDFMREGNGGSLSIWLTQIRIDAENPVKGNVQELWLNAIKEIQWMIMEARREDRPAFAGIVPPVTPEEHARLDMLWSQLEGLKKRTSETIDFGELEQVAAEIIPDADFHALTPQRSVAPTALPEDADSMPGMKGSTALVLPDYVREEVGQVSADYNLVARFGSRFGSEALRRLLNNHPTLCLEVMLLMSLGPEYEDLALDVLRAMYNGTEPWRSRYFEKLTQVLLARRLMVSTDSLKKNLGRLIALKPDGSFSRIDIERKIVLLMEKIESGEPAQGRVIVERYAKELRWLIGQRLEYYKGNARRRQHATIAVAGLRAYLKQIDTILQSQVTFRESINQLTGISNAVHGITSRRRF